MDGIRLTIHNLLLQNRSLIASDARDKVFGLLSLADTSNIQPLCIQPDHHLSAEQIYKNLAIGILQTRQDLNLFDALRVLEDSKTRSLPSWVPDWNTSDPCVPLCFRGPSWYGEPRELEPLVRFNASLDSKWLPSFEQDQTCSLSVESKLIKSNPLAGYLKSVISRASRTCSSFPANHATSSNFLLTGKILPARALTLNISWAKSSLMYTGKLYVLDKYQRDCQPLGRPSAISTTHSSGSPAHSFTSQSNSSPVLLRKTLGTTGISTFYFGWHGRYSGSRRQRFRGMAFSRNQCFRIIDGLSARGTDILGWHLARAT